MLQGSNVGGYVILRDWPCAITFASRLFWYWKKVTAKVDILLLFLSSNSSSSTMFALSGEQPAMKATYHFLSMFQLLFLWIDWIFMLSDCSVSACCLEWGEGLTTEWADWADGSENENLNVNVVRLFHCSLIFKQNIFCRFIGKQSDYQTSLCCFCAGNCTFKIISILAQWFSESQNEVLTLAGRQRCQTRVYFSFLL